MKDSEKIKTIREELIMTQKKMSEKLGISRAQVANIEQGIRSITPRLERDLITHLNVNPDWLKNGTEPIILKQKNYLGLDEDEKEFLELFETLDESSKNLIIETMKKIVSK